MSRTFYLRRDDEVSGPVTAQELRQMAAGGSVHKTDQIRPADQDKWYVASGVKGLFPDPVQDAHPPHPDTPSPREDSGRPQTPPSEGTAAIEAPERYSKRRLTVRGTTRVPLALAGGFVVVFVAVAVLSGRRAGDDLEAPELIGTWEADADLTRQFPGNQSLDREELDSDSWLFAIQMKIGQTFFPDGRAVFERPGRSGDFTYHVVRRNNDRIALQLQIVVDPELARFAEEGAFAAFESQWRILGENRIANKMNGESGEFWMVYRRIDQWEQMKREALEMPPIKWSCTEIDPLQQEEDFHKWYFETPFLVPEVYPTVSEWLVSDENEIDTEITNEPTGAQYRITGRRGDWGVWCNIKFTGNLNWDP